MKGYITLHKKIFKNKNFKKESFSKREAFIWMLCHAVYSEEYELEENTLKRGQLSYSLKYLANAWSWDISKVRRFLATQQSDTLFDIATDTGQTVITICNYDKYQIDLEKPTQQPTQQSTPQTDTNTKKKLIQKRNIQSYSDHFNAFWIQYPRKVAKKKAEEKYIIARKNGATEEEILSGLMRFSASASCKEKEFIPHASTWLHNKRWNDEDFDNPNQQGNNYERPATSGSAVVEEYLAGKQRGNNSQDVGDLF